MKISVVTVVYNRAATIGEAIDSVQAQNWGDVEHVIQDGGSVDGTLDIIRQRAQPNTVFVSELDQGIYDALNRGIRRSTGDVIGLMHSDDVFAYDGVLRQVAAAFEEPGIDGVYGDLQYVSAKDPTRVVRDWRAAEYHHALLKSGWMPPHPTLYLRKQVFERFGLYDTSFEIAADYDAILRYLVTGRIKLAYIPEVLVKMRLGGASNRSLGHMLKKSREDLRAIRKNGVGGTGTLIAKNLTKIGQFLVANTRSA